MMGVVSRSGGLLPGWVTSVPRRSVGAGRVCTLPKAFPKQLPEDLIRVYRDSDALMTQVGGGLRYLAVVPEPRLAMGERTRPDPLARPSAAASLMHCARPISGSSCSTRPPTWSGVLGFITLTAPMAKSLLVELRRDANAGLLGYREPRFRTSLPTHRRCSCPRKTGRPARGEAPRTPKAAQVKPGRLRHNTAIAVLICSGGTAHICARPADRRRTPVLLGVCPGICHPLLMAGSKHDACGLHETARPLLRSAFRWTGVRRWSAPATTTNSRGEPCPPTPSCC